ncbi:MAG: hypothetical protein Q3962_02505 [Corynebacterium sp.]|nr:hypothetical protein [Corynebacterium sp.]
MSKKGQIIWAIILVIIIAGGFAFMMQAKYTVPVAHINGDTLGRDASESLGDYQDRAKQELDAAPDGVKLWALVTFKQVVSTQEAAQAVKELGRVGSVVVDVGTPIAVPEPTGTEDRTAVFDRTIAHYSQAGAKISGVAGLVVYDTKEKLEQVAAESAVLSVEPSDADASRARMGIQKVL